MFLLKFHARKLRDYRHILAESRRQEQRLFRVNEEFFCGRAAEKSQGGKRP
jgi:hypothetical protein